MEVGETERCKERCKERCTFSRVRIASFIIGIRIALAMNPGESLEIAISSEHQLNVSPKLRASYLTFFTSQTKRFGTFERLLTSLQRRYNLN